MKIKQSIEALLNGFLGARRMGHTTAIMKGALNTPDVIFIAADQKQVAVLSIEFPGVKFITLSEFERLRARTGPIVMDHHAVAQVLAMASRTISEREDRLRKVMHDLHKVQSGIREYLEDEA